MYALKGSKPHCYQMSEACTHTYRYTSRLPCKNSDLCLNVKLYQVAGETEVVVALVETVEGMVVVTEVVAVLEEIEEVLVEEIEEAVAVAEVTLEAVVEVAVILEVVVVVAVAAVTLGVAEVK